MANTHRTREKIHHSGTIFEVTRRALLSLPSGDQQSLLAWLQGEGRARRPKVEVTLDQQTTVKKSLALMPLRTRTVLLRELTQRLQLGETADFAGPDVNARADSIESNKRRQMNSVAMALAFYAGQSLGRRRYHGTVWPR